MKNLRQHFGNIWKHLDERSRRLFAAKEAVRIGHGGITQVSQVCGLSRVTLTKAIKELNDKPLPSGRIRRPGGGRHRLEHTDTGLTKALEALIEPGTRGDPETPLRWTCKSTRIIARELKRQRHNVSHTKVGQMLAEINYSLQGNRKTEEGDDHPDRDAQFRHINSIVTSSMEANIPVISVDTKKKELVGNYYNKGRQWLRKRKAKHVQGHDFPDPEVPRAYPYGIYDIARNTGFVNVGTDHDTSEFAVASIRGWWKNEASKLYPQAKHLVITADSGGSNGYRTRLWKWELQRLANETGLNLMIRHFPPGTSKWNKIEHRLFSFISSNWRGEPLRDYETVVQLISNTKTTKGLSVKCRLDRSKYTPGRKISDDDYAAINISRQRFHGEWNYTIAPNINA